MLYQLSYSNLIDNNAKNVFIKPNLLQNKKIIPKLIANLAANLKPVLAVLLVLISTLRKDEKIRKRRRGRAIFEKRFVISLNCCIRYFRKLAHERFHGHYEAEKPKEASHLQILRIVINKKMSALLLKSVLKDGKHSMDSLWSNF